MSIQKHRAAIDKLDAQIVKLLNRRTKHVLGIGKAKLAGSKSTYQPDREQALLRRIRKLNDGPISDPTPSKADITVTRDLVRAGQLLKIEVLDHVILGQRTTDRARDYFSMKEHGYIYK